MVTTTIKVNGMMCNNCEKHVNEAVKKNFNVESVTSDHNKNVTVIVSEAQLDAAKLADVIKEEGYEPGEVTVA